MNKKLIGVALCFIMLSTIPVAAGLTDTASDESDGIFGRTVVRGVILFPRTEGRTTTFFAVFVHYTTYKLLGEPESGVLILKHVEFNGKFIGVMSKFYVAGTFRGTI